MNCWSAAIKPSTLLGLVIISLGVGGNIDEHDMFAGSRFRAEFITSLVDPGVLPINADITDAEQYSIQVKTWGLQGKLSMNDVMMYTQSWFASLFTTSINFHFGQLPIIVDTLIRVLFALLVSR